MIKQSSIDELRDKADLSEIVSRYTTIKKSTGCCPIHNEKSPSFHIYDKKQIYKCFGCGAGGDVFKLIMVLENKPFIEAAEWLAAHYNVTLEYDQVRQGEAQEVKDMRKDMLAVCDYAQGRYTKSFDQLPSDAAAKVYMQNRGYDEERCQRWGIGFAPDGFKFLASNIVDMGKYNTGMEMGIIGTTNGVTWDFFRNRITVPIHDQNGMIVGFGGRHLPSGDAKADKEQAKYLNPKESLVYNKKKIWYGLWQAQRAIKDYGFAYVTEGYMDVQSMQDAGMINTVASCGTEFDEDQAKFLKRHTDHVVMAFDGDAAGTKKTMKKIDILLQLGFKVGVVEFPNQMDPDEYVRHLIKEENLKMVAA